MTVNRKHFPYILLVALVAFFIAGILLGFAPSH